jgi:hypothetical protein
MQIKESKQCSVVEPSNFLAASAASDSDSSQSVDSSSPKQSKFPQALGKFTPSTLEVPQSGMTCIPSTPNRDNSTASLEEVRVKTSADVAKNGELKESDLDCGGKCSESSTSADPLSLAGRTLREHCIADVEKWLLASEWSDIKSRARSSYQQRNSEHRTRENGSSLLDTPTTYPQSLRGQGEAGRNKLESSLRLSVRIPTPRANNAVQSYNTGESGSINLTGYLRLATPASRDFKGISATKNQGASATLPENLQPFILKSESANPQVWGWMMGFPRNWCESVLMSPGSWESSERDGGAENPRPSKPVCKKSESKGDATASTTTEPPAYQLKPSPSHSELSICGNSFKTSGLGISFGKTLPYILNKTATRRNWKDSHAKKFINAFHQNKLIKALDKDIRYGGKQIGWCRLLCVPYKEQLSAMPQNDLKAEGGMCESVEQFIQRYFKGNGSLEVWVIRFEFIAADKQAQIQTATIPGVYSDSATKADSNSAITSLAESIHQISIPRLGVYPSSVNQTDSNATNDLLTEIIHQVPVVQRGSGLVYSFWKGESVVNHYRYKVKTNGTWQVKSVYIPVGKLPKVKEAIANKLSVTAIVVEVLGRNL